MVSSKLSSFQREVLDAIFARTKDSFFLTGGAALAGFHLGHRTTDDLALSTVDAEAFGLARYVMSDAAAALGATLDVRQDAAGFRRYALLRGQEALVVDTVLDRTVQLRPEKDRFGALLVDPPDEIVANKLREGRPLEGERRAGDDITRYRVDRPAARGGNSGVRRAHGVHARCEAR